MNRQDTHHGIKIQPRGNSVMVNFRYMNMKVEELGLLFAFDN